MLEGNNCSMIHQLYWFIRGQSAHKNKYWWRLIIHSHNHQYSNSFSLFTNTNPKILQLTPIFKLVFKTHFSIIKTIKSKPKPFIKFSLNFRPKTLKYYTLTFNFQNSFYYTNSSLKQHFQPFNNQNKFSKI